MASIRIATENSVCRFEAALEHSREECELLKEKLAELEAENAKLRERLKPKPRKIPTMLTSDERRQRMGTIRLMLEDGASWKEIGARLGLTTSNAKAWYDHWKDRGPLYLTKGDEK